MLFLEALKLIGNHRFDPLPLSLTTEKIYSKLGVQVMKGMVFTNFLEMVEDKFSPEMADRIIDASNLSTDGAYTSVGTYDHGELVEMIVNLSKESNIAVPDLIKVFGEYLFGRFSVLYPAFFQKKQTCFSFLELIDGHVHIEVRKLYPDVELPSFKTTRPCENSLKMTYQSERPFAPLAEGLIIGCIIYHQEEISLQVSDLSNGENKHVEFLLKKN